MWKISCKKNKVRRTERKQEKDHNLENELDKYLDNAPAIIHHLESEIANLKEKSLFRKLSKLKGLEIKYYDDPVPLGVFIFKDYIATFTFKEKPTVFLIRSEQIAGSYKEFFINLWRISW